MKTQCVVLALISVVSLLLARPLFSHSQLSCAHVVGALTDPSRAGVSDATITAKSESNSFTFDALGYPALGRTYTFGMGYSFAGRN